MWASAYSGGECQGLAAGGLRLFHASGVVTRDGQIVVGVGIGGPQCDILFVCGKGVVDPADGQEGDTHIVQRLAHCRVEFQGSGEGVRGIGVATFVGQGVAQIELTLGGIGRDGDGGLQPFQSLGLFAQLQRDAARQVQHVGIVAAVDRQFPAQGQGFAQFAGFVKIGRVANLPGRRQIVASAGACFLLHAAAFLAIHRSSPFGAVAGSVVGQHWLTERRKSDITTNVPNQTARRIGGPSVIREYRPRRGERASA